jgi:hypothetical protein
MTQYCLIPCSRTPTHQAAVESPFLEHVMPRASGVLCVLSLPQRVLSHDFSMAESALNDPEKYAIRAAVQVSRMRQMHSNTCAKVRRVSPSRKQARQRP